MNGYKSKHISMSAELHERVTAIAERLGCSFSKVVQVALKGKLPELEREMGSFQIDNRKSFDDMCLERLRAHRQGKRLVQLIGITAPPVAKY